MAGRIGGEDLTRILEAATVAVSRHHGQLRKGVDAPYALHPLRVASLVAGADPPPGANLSTCLVAALLHDTLEDTDWSAGGVEAAFGGEVASLVSELTQDRTLPKAERRERMIAHCASMSPGARFIKLADRLDNMREMENMPPDFIERYCREAARMVEAMAGTCEAFEEEILTIVSRHGGTGNQPPRTFEPENAEGD
jgi:guanosine-3',5'-bis(diphosphate) 3'-pyrophosphohydrolase